MKTKKNAFIVFFSVRVLLFGFCLCAFSFLSNAQNAVDSNQESTSRADEIINLSRKAIKKGKNSSKIDGLNVVFSVTNQTKLTRNDNKSTEIQEDNGERELNLSFNKIKFSENLGDKNRSSIYNFVLNNDRLESDSYGLSEGKRIDFQVKGQENPNEQQKKQELLNVKKELFVTLYPILLESADFSSLKFKYIGKAESNAETADVLETLLDEETTIKMFFDQDTHLLKMLIRNTKTPQFEFEEKRFYSNYKENDGLIVANKINIEIRQSNKAVNIQKFEEQTLKLLKINPTFKSNFFEIKKK